MTYSRHCSIGLSEATNRKLLRNEGQLRLQMPNRSYVKLRRCEIVVEMGDADNAHGSAASKVYMEPIWVLSDVVIRNVCSIRQFE
jgi:hypothetical protein